MRSIITIFLILFVCYNLHAQRPIGGGISQSASNPTVVQARPYGLVSEIELDFDKSNRDFFFLYEGWKQGSIFLLNNSKLEDTEFKYDIRYNLFEFNNDSEHRYLSGKKVKQFSLVDIKDRVFYNALYIKGFNFIGFVELLGEGEFNLYEHQTFEIQKANYIPALDAGEQKDKLLKKSDFYMYTGNIGTQIPSKKKKFLMMFGAKEATAKKILAEGKYRLSNRDDLISFFNLMNESSQQLN